jgi:L-fucose isomerase-like protein
MREINLNKLQVAFFPLVRTTFDVGLAEEKIRQARENLLGGGFILLGPPAAISDVESARAAVRALEGTEVDLLLVFQATFSDSTMLAALVEALDAPIFLWGVPETWSGERLRLNSLCGINLAAHSLKLRKCYYEYGYLDSQDPEILPKVRTLARAGALRRRLKTARLGVFGEHPEGMDTCHLDEALLLQTFGINIEHFSLADVFERARSIPEANISATRSHLEASLDNLHLLDQAPLRNTLSVYNALKDIASQRNLDGMAVRCWPEFFVEMGCAACGAMSMLSDGFGQNRPLPCSCEADINGAVTQLILQLLAGSPAFGTDIVGLDVEQDLIALWHCGLAPLSMADPSAQPRGGIHSNRQVPLVMDFPLKPGPITFARLSRASGNLRLVLGRGEMLPLPKPFSGTSGALRLECPASEFLESLIGEGLEHHIALVYGDFTEEILAFARLAGLPVLNLTPREVKKNNYPTDKPIPA